MGDREVLRDRIAEAIWRADYPESVGVRTWRDMLNKTHYRHLADAAIDAGADFFAPPWT